MASLFVSRDPTPIAQLNPDLPDQAERVVRGEVTITWPYNSVTQTTAFLLAEPDIRLRRAKGQVRIELHGPSAKAFSACGIGAGDEVLFSLKGAEWAKDESPGRVPGARLDWQLLFNQKLALQAKLSESNEPKHIDIDHPRTEAPVEHPPVEQPIPTEPEILVPEATPVVRRIADYELNEYPSPAFIKRARISYGSLFEGGLDMFEEDGGVVGKGRKRSRFGRDSNAWRYSSQSLSPEPETPVQDATEEDVVMETQPEPEPLPASEPLPEPVSVPLTESVSVPLPEPEHGLEKPGPKPQMADEGCQTIEFELTPASPVPVNQASQEVVPLDALSPRPETEAQATTPVGDSTANDLQRSNPDPAGSVEAAASSLFAISKPINPGFSMFGTISTVPVASTSDIADQVRFGFSHIPKTTGPSAMQHEPVTSEHHASPGPYPVPHVPAKFADMDSYVDAAEVEMETVEDRDVSPRPPTVESFGRGGWEMHTHYHDVEGGHFEAHVLIDGTRVGAEEPSLHSDAILPEMVPKGFDSYGARENSATVVSLDDSENRSVGSPEAESRDGPELVENFETRGRSDDEVGVEVDNDAEYDEYGDEVEAGDYDQREYNVPADDDEGLSIEDKELEQENAERYGEADVYNADEEQDEYGDDGFGEDGYDEDGESEGSYESEDDYHQQSPGAAFAAPSREPVVISLLSDSEDDDDEPPAPPSKQANSSRLSPKGASPQEHRMETATEDFAVHGHPSAETTTEMAPQHEVNHQIRDGNGLNSGENQIHAANDAVAVESIAHEKSLPQTLGETVENTVSSLAGRSPIAIETGEEKPEVKEIQTADGSKFITEPQPVMADGESQGSELDSNSDQDLDDLRNSASRLEKMSADWDSDEDLDADADADADQELEDEFMNMPDENGDDEEDEFANEDKGGLEEILEEVSEEADVDDDDMEIIEVEDEEVDHPASVMEEDAVGSPMEVEDISVPQVDSEMREASAEVISNNDNVRDVTSLEPEQFKPISPESREQENEPIGEDILMDDMPIPSPEASLQPHPHITDSGSVEMNGSDRAVVDNQGSEDDGEDVVCTSEVVIQEEAHTSTFNDEHVGVELSESTKVVSLSRQTKHSAIAPSSPPLTQPVQLRSDSESLPDVSRTSNKNDRPLPLLTPTESMITTQTASQFTVLEEQVDIEFRGHTLVASPKPETDYFNRPGEEFEDTQSNHVSEEDDTGVVLAESHAEPNVDEVMEEDSAASTPSPAPSAIVDQSLPGSALRDAEPVQPATPSIPKVNAEGETSPLEGSPPFADELGRPQPGPGEQEAEEKSVASESDTSSPARHLRVTRSGQTPRISKTDPIRDEITVSSPYSEDREQNREQNQNQEQSQDSEVSSPDLSINLARQSVAAKRSKKGAEPLRTSPRMTRGRSNSLQISVTSEMDEDPSFSFARASLASPSKHHPATTTEVPVASTASLKTELTKGLRKLLECVSLKNIKSHVDKRPNVVAIVASNPTTPSRAKGGPREYIMSFNVTDPSIAPLHVVEVQLYRPHKESLPVVKPGDAILLQGFQVKSLSKKGFGLRTGSDSAWAVYEEMSSDKSRASDDGAEELPPQIKGPPVEDYAEYGPYMTTLKAWYRSLDTTARNKLDKAVQKFEELGIGSSQK